MKVLAIGFNGLRRLLRDRSNIFFVFILPLALILLIGAQFGTSGRGARVVVAGAGGDVAGEIMVLLAESGLRVEALDGEDVVEEVARGGASAGIVLPPGLDEAVAVGRSIEIGLAVRPDSPGTLRPIVAAAVADVTADSRVGRVVAQETGMDQRAATESVAATRVPGVEVESETVGEALFGPDTGPFSVGAAQELVLFVFLTALTGSAALIQSRQLGVTGRMLSTPTSVREVVVGEGMARFLTGLFQGVYIVIVTLVAFGVDWGDPLGWIPLLVALAATGAGAAMLIGSTFDNDQQAGGISVLAGLGVAALGGAMLPLELFSPTMRRIAHLTPHAWAIDGLGDLMYRGGTAGEVAGEVGVLAGYAVFLLGVAGWRLRAKISRA